MKFITRFLLNVLVLLVISEVVDGISVNTAYAAIIAILILGLLNTLVRPILLILTLPINILTLGLFTFIINAGLFWFVATFVDNFDVSGFLPALLGSLILTVSSTLGSRWIK